MDASLDVTGRVIVQGKAFSGTGTFAFEILDPGGRGEWRSDNIQLPVVDGTYRVRLGDVQLGMSPLPQSALLPGSTAQLRIRFDDGLHGMHDVGLVSLGAHAAPSAPTPVAVSSTAVIEEVRLLRAEVGKLRSQVQQSVKPHLQHPSTVTVPRRQNHSLGSPDAPLVLMEFTDYQCGYCQRFFKQTFPELKERFIDTGKVLFISRDLPLAMHKQAQPAARASLCAGQQGKYWQMRDALFADIRNMEDAALLERARKLDLDVTAFEACLQDAATDKAVSQDVADARVAGITGTPSFVLGRNKADKVQGEYIRGGHPLATFEAKIGKLLEAGVK